MRNSIINIIVIALIFISCCIFSVYQHESAHQEISRMHGCINGTIEMNIFSDPSKFTCYDYGVRDSTTRLQEIYLQSLNEIIGYNIIVLMLGFFILCLTLVLVFGDRE